MHIFIFLLSAVGFLLLIFSLHLLFTQIGNRHLNHLLSLPLLARFAQVCVFLIITSPYQEAFPVFQKVCTPLLFLAPACSFLYVRGFIRDDAKLKKRDLIHFLPALLAVTHILPLPLVAPINWDAVSFQILTRGQLAITERTGLFSSQIYNIGQSILLGGYLIATWIFVIKSGFLKLKPWNTSKTWMAFYLSTSSFFKLLSFVALIFTFMGRSYATSDSFLLISCIVLLIMMAFIIYHPRILYGYIILSTQTENKNVEPILIESLTPSLETNLRLKLRDSANSASKIKLPTIMQEQFALVLKEHMENEKPFLLPDFQMKDLTNAVNIPIHHCSLVINQVMDKNFRDWLNSYRIQYFIQQYPALADQMTIEAVAVKSGFKNMTTFYNAFKKEIGQMPSSYFTNKESNSAVEV